MELGPRFQAAYILTPTELFYVDCGNVNKIDMDEVNLDKLKTVLRLTDNDMDKQGKALSDQDLEAIATISGYPKFSRQPIVMTKGTKAKMSSYDCIPTDAVGPLVNTRIKNILEDLAPHDVQFFPARVICADGELDGYYFLNVTSTFVGIDHEKSIYKKIYQDDAILGLNISLIKLVVWVNIY